MTTTFVHDAPNTNPRIETLYAILSADDKGEGIVAHSVGGMMVTLMTSEERLVPALVKAAKQIESLTAKKMRLVKFTGREDLQEIK